jgi:hypothetical protein
LRSFLKREEKYLQLQGRDLFAATKGAYFMLNPGAEYGKELLPEEIANLLDPQPSHHNVTVEKDTSVLIGQPKNPPTPLLDALSTLFKSHPEISAGYMAQVVYPNDAAHPHCLIGIETSDDWEALTGALGPVIDGVNIGMIVDVVPVTRDGANKTLSDSLLRYAPFYRRGGLS